MAEPYIEQADGWYAPSIRGSSIGRIVLEDTVSLHVGSDTVVLRGPFHLDRDGESSEQVPGDPARLGAVATLLGTVCRALRLEHGGLLVLDLADGRTLRAPSMPQFSAWEVFVRGTNMVACRPGGGFDLWGRRQG